MKRKIKITILITMIVCCLTTACLAGANDVNPKNLTLTNYSDLKRNYGDWEFNEQGATYKPIVVKTGLQSQKISENKGINDSLGPGSTGLLQFSIRNCSKNSVDVAIEVTLHSEVPLTDKTDTNTGDECTIEGLGKPVKSEDKKTLTYRMLLGTFNGTKEETDNGVKANQEAFFAYNVKCTREAGNNFQNNNIKIDVAMYAIQHQQTANNEFDVEKVGNDQPYSTGLISIGDWGMVDSFKTTS